MLCAHPDNFSLGLSNAQIKHAVSKCVADALKPLYANGKLGKEDYKWVARKSVHKILEQPSSKVRHAKAGLSFELHGLRC